MAQFQNTSVLAIWVAHKRIMPLPVMVLVQMCFASTAMDNNAAYAFPEAAGSMAEMILDDVPTINIDDVSTFNMDNDGSRPFMSMLSDHPVECHVDSECNLLVPLCVAGRCKPIPGFNTTVGRCECENCEMVIIERNESTTARACAGVCARMKNCVGMEANYINETNFNCTIFDANDKFALFGNGVRSHYCYASPLVNSQCKKHSACIIHKEEFCCPTLENVMQHCCSAPLPLLAIPTMLVIVILALVCSLLCNCRQCCSNSSQLASRQTVIDRDPIIIPPALQHISIDSDGFVDMRRALQDSGKYIIVLQNPGSGDQRVNEFQSLVNDLLGEYGKAYMLPGQLRDGFHEAVARQRAGQDTRLLACGGDGTVSWVLSALQDEREGIFQGQELPLVGIIPLGTGNDLARSLGWGPCLMEASELVKYMHRAVEAVAVELDQWKLTLRPKSFLPPSLILRTATPEYTGYFTNYFSVGLDAKTTYDVGRAREHTIGRCCFRTRCCKPCRFIHGGLLCYGLNAPNCTRCWCCQTRALNSDLEVRFDGEVEARIFHRGIRQFTLTNLNSYGAGMAVYSSQEMRNCIRPNDGRLEVFTREGPYSVIGMTLANKIMKSPCGKIAVVQQPHRVEMKLRRGQYFQMDGEPWILNSGCIAVVEHNIKVRMLCPSVDGPGAGIWQGNQERNFWMPHLPIRTAGSPRH